MGSKQHGGLRDDLQNLREDVSNLVAQLTESGGELGGDVKMRIQKISEDIDEAISQAGSQGRELGREIVRQTQTGLEGVGGTIESSVREHPYTTLAIAVGVGALVGSQLRR